MARLTVYDSEALGFAFQNKSGVDINNGDPVTAGLLEGVYINGPDLLNDGDQAYAAFNTGPNATYQLDGLVALIADVSLGNNATAALNVADVTFLAGRVPIAVGHPNVITPSTDNATGGTNADTTVLAATTGDTCMYVMLT